MSVFVKRELKKGDVYYFTLPEIIGIAEGLSGVRPGQEYLSFDSYSYVFRPRMKYAPAYNGKPNRKNQLHRVQSHNLAIINGSDYIIASPFSAIKAGLMIRDEEEIRSLLQDDVLIDRIIEYGHGPILQKCYSNGVFCDNAFGSNVNGVTLKGINASIVPRTRNKWDLAELFKNYLMARKINKVLPEKTKISSKYGTSLDSILGKQTLSQQKKTINNVSEVIEGSESLNVKTENVSEHYGVYLKQPIKWDFANKDLFIAGSHDIDCDCMLNNLAAVKEEFKRIFLHCHHSLAQQYLLKHGCEGLKISISGREYSSHPNMIVFYEPLISFEDPELVKTALQMKYYKPGDYDRKPFSSLVDRPTIAEIDAWLNCFPEKIHSPEINKVISENLIGEYERKVMTAELYSVFDTSDKVMNVLKTFSGLTDEKLISERLRDWNFINRIKQEHGEHFSKDFMLEESLTLAPEKITQPLRIAKNNDYLIIDGWPYKHKKLVF